MPCLIWQQREGKLPWEISIGILGGGELGELLKEHFSSQGYTVSILDVKFKRKGGVTLQLSETERHQLDHIDFVINLLPTGEDFINCGIAELLDASSSVIDFSRPAIPREQLRARVFMGNRVQRPGMRFMFSLPGDWRKNEIPACSMPSILAANFGIVENDLRKFCRAARQVAFGTALAPAMEPLPSPLFSKVQSWGHQLQMACRPYFCFAKERVFQLCLLKERV